jgi:tetratricopeptide (TPR) repeat protein
MARRNGGEGGAGQVLRLVPGFDPSRLELTAEEGFLLSRIDGRTPWGLLVEMASMERARAADCLANWLAGGVVESVPSDALDEVKPVVEAHPFGDAAAPSSVDASLIDPSLEIDASTQRRILEFETHLNGSYHERLGVEPGADDRAIKKAYFALSREFHPDRFFRCDLGHHAERVSLIFKKILEAYEVLSVSPSAAGPESNPRGASGQPSAVAKDPLAARPGTQAPAEFEKLQRLGQRAIHTLPPALRRERRQKAGEFFEASQKSAEEGRLQEAATSLRLAIGFDPENLPYRRRLTELKAQALEAQAFELLDESKSYATMSNTELDRTMKSLEKLLPSCPQDSVLAERAVLVALARKDVQRAQVLAEAAVDGSPHVARFHTLLGRIHRIQGNAGRAIREFGFALERDSGDLEARRELDVLLRRAGLTMPGGARG